MCGGDERWCLIAEKAGVNIPRIAGFFFYRIQQGGIELGRILPVAMQEWIEFPEMRPG
jgi:hypothetical protein